MGGKIHHNCISTFSRGMFKPSNDGSHGALVQSSRSSLPSTAVTPNPRTELFVRFFFSFFCLLYLCLCSTLPSHNSSSIFTAPDPSTQPCHSGPGPSTTTNSAIRAVLPHSTLSLIHNLACLTSTPTNREAGERAEARGRGGRAATPRAAKRGCRGSSTHGPDPRSCWSWQRAGLSPIVSRRRATECSKPERLYIPITVVWFVTAWPRGLMYLCPWELKVIYLCPWEVNDISVSVGGQVSLPLIADILIYSVRSSIDAIQHHNY